MSIIAGWDMPTLVFELTVKSILLLGVVLCLTWFMRRASAAVRHLYFSVAAIALVVLPIAGVLLPSWHPDPLSNRLGPLFAPAGRITHEPVAADTPAGSSENRVESRARMGGKEVGTDATFSRSAWQKTRYDWFFLIWLAGASVLLMGLTAGKLFSARTVGRARVVEDKDILDVLDDVRRRLDLRRQVAVLESDRITVPTVTGILHAKLLVPPQVLFWPRARLVAVFHHELSHVKRHDILAQFFAQVACCLYWPNPLVWITERRLFIERERACDDLVLGRDVKASDYAEHLMEVLEEMGESRRPLWVTAAMADGTDFKDRILSVLNPAAARSSPGAAHLFAVIAVGLLVVLPLSALHPWTSQAAPDRTVTGAPATRDADDSRTAVDADRSDVTRVRTTDKEIPFSVWIEQLKSPSVEIRQRAALALGQSGNRLAVLPLMDALGDEDPGVRENAARALGKLEDPRAVPRLCGVLLDDVSAVVREHAATALGSIGDERAQRPLLSAMQSDPDPVVREHASSALRQLQEGR